ESGEIGAVLKQSVNFISGQGQWLGWFIRFDSVAKGIHAALKPIPFGRRDLNGGQSGWVGVGEDVEHLLGIIKDHQTSDEHDDHQHEPGNAAEMKAPSRPFSGLLIHRTLSRKNYPGFGHSPSACGNSFGEAIPGSAASALLLRRGRTRYVLEAPPASTQG